MGRSGWVRVRSLDKVELRSEWTVTGSDAQELETDGGAV